MQRVRVIQRKSYVRFKTSFATFHLLCKESIKQIKNKAFCKAQLSYNLQKKKNHFGLVENKTENVSNMYTTRLASIFQAISQSTE